VIYSEQFSFKVTALLLAKWLSAVQYSYTAWHQKTDRPHSKEGATYFTR